jgi:hypothetical protein
MMDSSMYPTTQDPNRKKHLTEGTKEKAETKQNSVLQAKTEEEGEPGTRSLTTAPGTSPTRRRRHRAASARKLTTGSTTRDMGK